VCNKHGQAHDLGNLDGERLYSLDCRPCRLHSSTPATTNCLKGSLIGGFSRNNDLSRSNICVLSFPIQPHNQTSLTNTGLYEMHPVIWNTAVRFLSSYQQCRPHRIASQRSANGGVTSSESGRGASPLGRPLPLHSNLATFSMPFHIVLGHEA